MIGWHHRLNGPEFEQTLGDGEEQESLGVLQSMGSQRIRQNLVIQQHQQHESYSLISRNLERRRTNLHKEVRLSGRGTMKILII